MKLIDADLLKTNISRWLEPSVLDATEMIKVGRKKFRTISDSYADRERWWS